MVKVPGPLPPSTTAAAAMLAERVVGLAASADRELVEETLPAINAAVKRVEAGAPARFAPPKGWLETLGAARWQRGSPLAHLQAVAAVFGKRVAVRFYKVITALHRVNRAITEAVRPEFISELVRKFESKVSRLLSFDQLQALRWRIVGRAAEDTLVHDAHFIAFVEGEAGEVAELAADQAFLAKHGLAELSSEPLLVTNVRTAGVAGQTEARRPYVDLVVLFRGKATDGSVRYLVKVRGQVKLARVDLLISGLDLNGEFRIGQLAKDELRKARGPWFFNDVKITPDMLVQDASHTKLVTAGSRALTTEELERLRLLDGVSIKHFEHQVPYEHFYQWADEAIRQLGITVKP